MTWWLRWAGLRTTCLRGAQRLYRRLPLNEQLSRLYGLIRDHAIMRRQRLPLELTWDNEGANIPYKYWLSQVLHEATLVAVEIDTQQRLATVIVEVLMLPEVTSAPPDRHIKLVFSPMGRIAMVRYPVTFENVEDDIVEMARGAAIPCTIESLEETVCYMAGQPLYLDRFCEDSFFDVDEPALAFWGRPLSLDWQAGPNGITHSFFLFQEGDDEHLELVLWFDTLDIRTLDGRRLDLSQLVRDNDHWWKAFYANDPRTQGTGLYPI